MTGSGQVISDDVLIEELAKEASFNLLVRNALATIGVLIVLVYLKGFETWHPAGALLRFI